MSGACRPSGMFLCVRTCACSMPQSGEQAARLSSRSSGQADVGASSMRSTCGASPTSASLSSALSRSQLRQALLALLLGNPSSGSCRARSCLDSRCTLDMTGTAGWTGAASMLVIHEEEGQARWPKVHTTHRRQPCALCCPEHSS